MIYQDDFTDVFVAFDAFDFGGVFGDEVTLIEQTLMDGMIEQGRFAGPGDAAQAHQSL